MVAPLISCTVTCVVWLQVCYNFYISLCIIFLFLWLSLRSLCFQYFSYNMSRGVFKSMFAFILVGVLRASGIGQLVVFHPCQKTLRRSLPIFLLSLSLLLPPTTSSLFDCFTLSINSWLLWSALFFYSVSFWIISIDVQTPDLSLVFRNLHIWLFLLSLISICW